MSALLFGSISTIADTSELQRDAFNKSFAHHGLNWSWSREQYMSMLGTNGGQKRIAEYAHTQDQTVDAAAIHQTKSQIFQDSLATTPVQARAGVTDTIKVAKQEGIKVAFVTTTSPENISALMTALSPTLTADDFDLIVDSSAGQAGKPDKASYEYALSTLGERAENCVAIEDNLGGVHAATAAGLRCIAFPNVNTATQHFPTAQTRVTALHPAETTALVAG